MKAPTAPVVDSRVALVEPGLADLAGRVMTPDLMNRYMGLLASACGRRKVTPEMAGALHDSLDHLAGRACDAGLLRRNATRVLANWQYIADGMAVPEWDGTAIDSEVLFVGLRRPTVVQENQRYVVKLKLKTGLGAGIISCAGISASAAGYFVDHVAGVAVENCAPEEISGMRCSAVVILDRGFVGIRSWKCNDRQRRANRDLARLRGTPTKCHRGIPCSVCPETIQSCPLAVWLPFSDKKDKQEEKTKHA